MIEPTDESGAEHPGFRRAGLFVGLALLLLVVLLPPPAGLTVAAWRVSGLGVLMAVWWVTEAIPLPATSLLAIPLLPLLGVTSVEEATAPYANSVVFLFMGGFMLAQAMERWDLHRRIAFGIIGWTGTAPRRLVGGFLAASGFLSMWVSNTAVAVMMLPIGLSVIQVVRDGSARQGRANDPAFAVAVLLSVAYGATIGGMTTIIGTPPTAFLAAYMSEQGGTQVGFGQWMLVGVPLALILLPLTWLIVTRVVVRVDPLGPQLEPDVLGGLRAGLGPIRPSEVRTAWIFGAAAVAWITGPVLARWIPGLSDAGVAILATLALFLVPAGGAERGPLLTWEWARRIPWDVLLLFGGGLSLAAAISSSGLSSWIGEAFQASGQVPLIVMMAIVCGTLVFMSELVSNTAAAAAFVPIVSGLAIALGYDPFLLAAPAALGSAGAFMLPVGTPPNAIVFGTGLMRMEHMVRAGFLLNLSVIVVVPILVYFVLPIVFGIEIGDVPPAGTPGP